MTGPSDSQHPQIWRYFPKRKQVDRDEFPSAPGRGPINPPAEQNWSYTLRDFLMVLFKQKRIITTFFAAVMVTVVIGLIFKRPIYEATAAILVKSTRAELPISPTETDAVMVRLSEEDLNSEVEILKSLDLVEAVLDRIGGQPARTPGLVARGKGLVKRALGMGGPKLSDTERQVLALARGLSFELIPRSNVINIGFRDESPDRAAEVVGALLHEYLVYRVQVHQDAQAAAFFDEQTEIAERQLTEVEDSLQEYAQGTGVSTSHDEQMLLALQRLDQFERSLAQAYVDVQRDENRVAALQERLSDVPERLPTPNRYNQDPETEQIRANLVELRLERDGLTTRGYSPSNVRVRDLDARIQLAENRLNEAEQRVGDINRTEVNVVHQEIKSQLLSAQADLAGTRAQYNALRGQVEAFRGELENLNKNNLDITRLMREATAAEQSYLLYRQKRDEAQVSQAMDQQNMVNVNIAREPRRPLQPAGPSKTMLLASALVLASIGGVGVGFVRDFFDHSFTTGEDIERGLNLRHLASIPDFAEANASEKGVTA